MYTLSNENVCLSINEEGKLVELTNKQTSTNYAGGKNIWRLIYQDGISLEEKFNDEGVTPEIECNGKEIKMTYDESNNRDLAFIMKITISLTADDYNFDIELDNKDDKRIIRECFFPMIANCNIEEGHELYWTRFGGERFKNISSEIDKCHTKYMAQDNKEVQMSTLYPGFTAMNYFIIGSEREGLYIASHDKTFQVTNHFLGKSINGEINAAIDKYPFLAPGEKTQINNAVVSPYSGSWHMAAKKYRSWSDSWYTKPEIPDSIKDMTSWQRIIMRHQYGKTLFRYDQLEDILNDGLQANVKTIFMFGWHNAGHDAGYPDYSCDEKQGGFNGLKENVKKFKDGGGQVILYFNGRLIDMDSDFYKKGRCEASIKRANGSETNEFYKFGADGTALSQFGNKSFVTACPSSEEWQDILKQHIDMAYDLGCDGVFFDQLGLMPDMCFDTSHGHKAPFTDVMAVNAENLKALRAYTKSKDPQMSFGTEWISDITAQHVDFIHTIFGGTSTINDWEKGEKPQSDKFLEMFYYTFPEIPITDREIRDDTDIERRVNFALLKGLRSDVEVYRCRATIAETPHYSSYLAKANLLREKYGYLILNGLYRDTDFIELDNPELFATSFTDKDKMAVIVTQSHLNSADATLTVPGYSYCEHDGLNSFTVEPSGSELKVNLGKHGLAIIILEKIK